VWSTSTALVEKIKRIDLMVASPDLHRRAEPAWKSPGPGGAEFPPWVGHARRAAPEQ
jgi:hypothetical protein